MTVYGSRRVCASGRVDGCDGGRGVRVVALPSPAGKHSGPLLLQLLAAAHAVALGDYDVVHLHASENGVALPLLRLRYPVVATSHGPAWRRAKWGRVASRLMKASERLFVRLADAATAVSRVEAERLSQLYGREVRYVPNGVDADEPADAEAAGALVARLGLEPGRFVLFASGRMDPTKGCHTLLRALRRLERPPATLVLGDLGHAPAYDDELRSLAAGLPVLFQPRIQDRGALLGLMAGCGALVFPSEFEGMSIVLLEALAVGAAVLASDIPENVDVLPPGTPVFRVGDDGDLARALAGVLAWDPAERAAHAAEAAEWARVRFSWDPIAARYSRLYEEVCAAYHRRVPLPHRTRRLAG